MQTSEVFKTSEVYRLKSLRSMDLNMNDLQCRCPGNRKPGLDKDTVLLIKKPDCFRGQAFFNARLSIMLPMKIRKVGFIFTNMTDACKIILADDF